MSAGTLSAWVAVKRAAIGAASEKLQTAARLDSAPSSTMRMSSMRSSRGRGSAHRIGEAAAASVEEDEARERGETLEEPRRHGLLPQGVDVEDPVRDEDQVARSVAYYVVREVEVAVARVSGLRCRHERRMRLVPTTGFNRRPTAVRGRER